MLFGSLVVLPTKALVVPLSSRRKAPSQLRLFSSAAAPLELEDSEQMEAATVVLGTLEAMKGSEAFANAWDDDRPLKWDGSSGIGGEEFFGFGGLEEACDRGQVSEAGRGVVMEDGSWNMARVGVKGAAVPWKDVNECLATSSTVVLNSADARCPRLAAMSFAALEAFGLPVCVNAYATGRKAFVSAPPHTDAQRVLVFQTRGQKRWRVFEPPDVRLRAFADPLTRGKGKNGGLYVRDLECILDVVLGEGDVLYVPAGFPHTTETMDSQSLHLTLGIDTHVWGLDAQVARKLAMQRKGLVDVLSPERDLEPSIYWKHSRKTLPRLGWRATGEDDLLFITDFLATAITTVDGLDDKKKTLKDLDLKECAWRLVNHRSDLVAAQKDLYKDVLKKGTNAATNKHFARLEQIQTEFLAWFDDKSIPKTRFKVGSKVQANMQAAEDDTLFFDALVDAVRPDGTYDLVFFDGDVELGLSEDRLRPRQTKKKKKKLSGFGPPPSSKKQRKK